ncbi:hypothetical protein ACQ86N_16945 [Puia sp. P3]|uniref:hypothetical protein n=1 Tax=Puia sp. P3 TaxID=3423952 RepID=UPI003D666FB1
MKYEEQQVDDQEPGRYGGGAQFADDKEDHDRKSDDKVEDEAAEIAQLEDTVDEEAFGRMGQPLDERSQEETNITNKCHPGEKSEYLHILPKIPKNYISANFLQQPYICGH